MFQPALPPRKPDAHKGSFGSVAVIGGDESMVGALLLAARAALLSGAGRVYAAALSKRAPVVDVNHPEIMMRSSAALMQLDQLNCVAIGPGLGQSNEAIELLAYWLAQQLPLLLDADALNLIAIHPHLLNQVKNRQAATVITPHAGEAARLLASSAEYIQQNRIDCALKLSQKLHAVCVLKGAGTVCAHYDGSYFVNTTGNPALATGGTGDVLSGIVASLIAQGLGATDAAKLGVYVHGAAADALLKKGLGPVGVTASEVALEVRNVLNRLNKSNYCT
ncbi:MAG: NAD(P)H-hydrate dehydratase [Methylotenera sp.]|nr:NAD(P)H-hydrate dehydratase [Methylotenera sp.]MDP1754622.1 NAD(P)H-hydrate dehydratase [Methylotenera sp.]MDP1959878.1 NAD(P)H-hydrate dehydratase [Methylotenera sp.]MDP3206554.1 NAD(P)H-hydrate dehydratase [Methylotenera sp.]MDP3303900.1 NAD(P)H-hydrate dehydratase [Methylotenera sp.]